MQRIVNKPRGNQRGQSLCKALYEASLKVPRAIDKEEGLKDVWTHTESSRCPEIYWTRSRSGKRCVEDAAGNEVAKDERT